VAAAATARAKVKRRDHARDVTIAYTFASLRIGTYEKLRAEADKLPEDLASGAANAGVWERDVLMHWIRNEISLSLGR
jgi:hypothetical protein